MYYYILNPAAGHGAINQMQEKLRGRLNELGISGEFAKTTGPGEATKMAEKAIEKGHTTIVAVGGDGTVNEVMNGITKDNVAIGIIPIGNSNTLAEKLGIKNWQQACEVLAARRLVSFDLMAAGAKYFLSTLTIGFETHLDKQVEYSGDDLKSKLSHFATGWGHAQSFDQLQCHIKIDDRLELDSDMFTMSVANQKFLNPMADNKLVVSITEKPGGAQRAGYLWQLIRGQNPLEDTATTRFFADRLLVTTKPETGIMIDGKVAGRTPIAIRLTDRHVRFICEKQRSAFRAEK